MPDDIVRPTNPKAPEYKKKKPDKAAERQKYGNVKGNAGAYLGWATPMGLPSRIFSAKGTIYAKGNDYLTDYNHQSSGHATGHTRGGPEDHS